MQLLKRHLETQRVGGRLAPPHLAESPGGEEVNVTGVSIGLLRG